MSPNGDFYETSICTVYRAIYFYGNMLYFYCVISGCVFAHRSFPCWMWKDCEDHAALLCSLLLGFGLDAYVCIGTKVKGQPHCWVMTIDTDGLVTFWESLNGSRYVVCRMISIWDEFFCCFTDIVANSRNPWYCHRIVITGIYATIADCGNIFLHK